MGMSPVAILSISLSVFKKEQCRLSNLRKGNVALSNLRVQDPECDYLSLTLRFEKLSRVCVILILLAR